MAMCKGLHSCLIHLGGTARFDAAAALALADSEAEARAGARPRHDYSKFT